MAAGERTALVLVVESDPAVQKLVATIFKLWLDARVVAAADGEQGLELARELRPDLAIIALRLPRLDGFEVARRLKADPLTQSIPLLALTSEPLQTVLAAGFDHRIFRPFNVRELVDTLNGYLGDSRASGTAVDAVNESGSEADLMLKS